jgi:AAA ATPase domain
MSPESLSDPIAELAVLATFDPNRPPADAMTGGLLESNSIEVEPDHGHQAFMLSESARIEALAEVLRRGGRSGLGEVRAGIEPHYRSPLQRMLDAFVLEGDIPLAERTEDELAASLHVERWSTAALARAALSGERVRPSREEIEGRIRVFDVERPIHALLQSGFIGRREELARLKAYLGPRRTEGPLGLHGNPALLVHGVGGMGKSALVARFVKDLIEANERPKPIWAYLDFDRPTLQPQPVAPDLPQSALRARLVLQDLVRQFGAQRTDLRSLLEYDVTFAQQAVKAAGLESFAGEDYLSGGYKLAETLQRVVGDAPIVIVLDTFEEVERRGPTDAQQLHELFDKLASALPTFRLVVSGRTPAISFRTSLENELSVGELTEDDAREVLQHFILAEGGEGVVRPDSAKIVWEIVGRSPLSLRLAARAVADEGIDALTDVARRAQTLGRIRTEFIRGFLYHRIIDHLRAPNPRLRDPLKAVARAGLVLRQITRPAIEHVLLPVVGRDPSLAGPLFEALSRESALVRRLDANTLGVREELRGPALSALKLDDAGLVRRLHEQAAAFYAGGSVGEDPVEAVFHYLAAGEGLEFGPAKVDLAPTLRASLGIELTRDILYSLERSSAELPREAVDFVEAALKSGVLDAEGEQIVWERQVASVVDTALRSGHLEAARQALQERDARRPTTELYRLDARICEAAGDLDGAIAAAQRDLGAARIAELPKRFARAVAYLANLLERRGRASGALAVLADADADPLLAGEWGLRLELVLNWLAAAERTSLENDDMRWQLGLRARQYLTHLNAGARETPALDRLLAAVLGVDEPKYIRDAIRRVGLDPNATPDLGARLGRALAEWDRELVLLDGTEGRVARAIRLTDQSRSEDAWIAFVTGLGENARDVFGDAFWELNPPLAVLSALRVFYLYWGYNEIREPGESNVRVGVHFLDEAPLKFSRAEVRELHSRLIASYPKAYELERLASVLGIDFNVIDWNQPVSGVTRELLINASRHGRMGALVRRVLNDVSAEQAERVRNLIGSDWLARNGVGEPGTGLLDGNSSAF